MTEEYTLLPAAVFESTFSAVERKQSGKTYRLDAEAGRIVGMTDGLDAVKQAVFCILQTERYMWNIYSRKYGAELGGLFGKSTDYAGSEIKRLITEALIQDDRIDSVDGWEISADKNALFVQFTVHTVHGDFDAGTEVMV